MVVEELETPSVERELPHGCDRANDPEAGEQDHDRSSKSSNHYVGYLVGKKEGYT